MFSNPSISRSICGRKWRISLSVTKPFCLLRLTSAWISSLVIGRVIFCVSSSPFFCRRPFPRSVFGLFLTFFLAVFIFKADFFLFFFVFLFFFICGRLLILVIYLITR